jgi:hypothetical protein
MSTTPPSATAYNLFWEPSFKPFYDSYYQELASEALAGRWQKIDATTSFLVAFTATTSAVAGWALWKTDGGKIIWAIIAAAASVASIVHSVFSVPGRIKEQEELRRLFQHLRLAIDKFRSDLAIGLMTVPAAQAEYDKLQEQYRQTMQKTKTEITYTDNLRDRVTARLRDILKKEGYI